MGKNYKKALKKLQARQEEFDKLSVNDQKGRKRPGSMNRRKGK